eukprot:COSAG02_NODE_5679_length_4134_cov_1.968773_2_plen_793_part_00
MADQLHVGGTGGAGLPPPPAAGHSHTHEWFAELVGACDRQEMPIAVAEQLLRDTEFRPRKRPASVIGAAGPCSFADVQSACLSRSQRVFKEMAPQPRRTKAVDKWHNAGGSRSRKVIPNAESPVLWRRYGAVYMPIEVAGGGIQRMAMYTYHEYTLAGDETQLRHPVLFHIFLTKALSEHMVKAATSQIVDQPHRNQGTPSQPAPASASHLRSVQPGLSTPAIVFAGDTATLSRTGYIKFKKSTRSLGEISETPSGGILMTSRAGDFAEWHEVNDEDGPVQEGDIVAIVEGRLSRRWTATAQLLGVVSKKAMLEGSAVPPGDNRQCRAVAYAGRVPVNVRGPCKPGDHITFSGLEDGTGIRATSSRQPSVGKVVSTGSPPDSAGKVWQVEIAVLPPGSGVSNFGSDRLETRCTLPSSSRECKRRSLAVLVLVAFATCMAYFGTDVEQLGQHNSASLPNTHRSSQPAGPARPGVVACGRDGWFEVQDACSADSDRFRLFSVDFLEGHYQRMFQTVQHIDHLNLAGLGIVWGSGICSSNSTVHSSSSLNSSTAWLPTLDAPTGVSECASALRIYLESCANGPLLGLSMKAGNATNKSTASTAEFGPDSARKLSPSVYGASCFGLECAGTLDLLFAQQCLSEAFPGIFNVTRTLASQAISVPGSRAASATDKSKTLQQCTSAAEALFSECSACSSAECSGDFEHDSAQPAMTCDSHPPNGVTESTADNKSGCACQCYAKGTKCAGAMLEALRVSAHANGGCSTHGSGMMPSAAVLTVMLYSAQGIRDIPTVGPPV